MAKIQIGVIDPPEEEKTNMEVPDNVDVKSLVEAMVQEMGLPIRGPTGRDTQYELNARASDGRLSRLDPKMTLAQNGVESGAILRLTVEMVAGGAGAPWEEPGQ